MSAVVWQGDLGQEPARVRRLDADTLIAERRDHSYEEGEPCGWRATDDEDAMRCFEQALLKELGSRGLPPSKGG